MPYLEPPESTARAAQSVAGPAAVNGSVVLALLTCALSVVFLGMLLRRFGRRRAAHLLVWSLGLLWYAISAACEALGGSQGWTVGLYRAWYITGAIGVAAYLGAGTVYLHRERVFGACTVACIVLASLPALLGGDLDVGAVGLIVALGCASVLIWRPVWLGHTVFFALLITSGLATLRIWSAAVDPSLLPVRADEVVTGQALDPSARMLTPGFNIAGAALLVLGALVSGVAFWRTRRPRRLASNGLIALGAFVPSLTSGLTRFGLTSGFFVGQLIGVVCLLAGFLLSAAPSPPASAPPRQGPVA